MENNPATKKDFQDSLLKLYESCRGARSIDSLSSLFVNYAAEAFQVTKASFMMLDETREEIMIKAYHGLDPALAGSRVKLGSMFSGKVAKEGVPLLVKDIEEEFPDASGKRVSHYSSKSFIIAPVKAEEITIGVFSLTDKKSKEVFNEEDLKNLLVICDYFGICIENISLAEKIKSLATLDPLTGLLNHRYFQDQLLEEIYRAERYNRPLSLVLLDIDKFSEYNRDHGYLAGDNVLKQIGKLIKDNTRQVDIVGRFGQDEFAVILPETKVREAAFVCDKIRERINSAVFTETEARKSALGMARLTASAGVAEHKTGLSKEDLIIHAQSALKQAQDKGKNCVCVYK